jgi:hypothetical protein
VPVDVESEDLQMIQWAMTHPTTADSIALADTSLKPPLKQQPSGTMMHAERGPSGGLLPAKSHPSGSMAQVGSRSSGAIEHAGQRPSGAMAPAKESCVHDALVAARESVGRLRVAQERKLREK